MKKGVYPVGYLGIAHTLTIGVWTIEEIHAIMIKVILNKQRPLEVSLT